MIICLLLDISDIGRRSSSSEILLFDKEHCQHTSIVKKDKYQKLSANCFKMSTLSNKELL